MYPKDPRVNQMTSLFISENRLWSSICNIIFLGPTIDITNPSVWWARRVGRGHIMHSKKMGWYIKWTYSSSSTFLVREKEKKEVCLGDQLATCLHQVSILSDLRGHGKPYSIFPNLQILLSQILLCVLWLLKFSIRASIFVFTSPWLFIIYA